MSRLASAIAIMVLAAGCCNGGICSMRNHAAIPSCGQGGMHRAGCSNCAQCKQGLAIANPGFENGEATQTKSSFRPPNARFHPVPTAPVFHPAPEVVSSTFASN